METRPKDTTIEAWTTHREILRRIGSEARFAVAIELSDTVRAIQVEGVCDRNPEWSHPDAVRHIVARQYGVELPRRL